MWCRSELRPWLKLGVSAKGWQMDCFHASSKGKNGIIMSANRGHLSQDRRIEAHSYMQLKNRRALLSASSRHAPAAKRKTARLCKRRAVVFGRTTTAAWPVGGRRVWRKSISPTDLGRVPEETTGNYEYTDRALMQQAIFDCFKPGSCIGV